MGTSALSQTVVIQGDSTQFKQDIESDILALKQFGQTMDSTNQASVESWRAQANATKEAMTALGATEQQMRSVEQVTRDVEGRIQQTAGSWMAATEQMSHGVAELAEGSGRSMRGIVSLLGGFADLAAGPFAPLIAGAGLATFAIVELFEKAAKEQEQTIDAMWKVAKNAEEKLSGLGLSRRAQEMEPEVASRQADIDALQKKINTEAQQEGGAIQAVLDNRRLTNLKEQLANLKVIHDTEAGSAQNERDRGDRTLAFETLRNQLAGEFKDILADTAELHKAEVDRNAVLAVQWRQKLTDAQALLATTQGELGGLPFGLSKEQSGQLSGMQATFAHDTQQQQSNFVDADLPHALQAAAAALAQLPNVTPGAMKTPHTAADFGAEGVQQAGSADIIGRHLATAFKEAYDKTKHDEEHDPKSVLAKGQSFTVPPGADQIPSKLEAEWHKAEDAIKAYGKSFDAVMTDSMNRWKTQADFGKAAAESYTNFMNTATTAIVSGQKNATQELKKAAVDPIVTALEARAKLWATDALGDAAAGDFVGAAEYAAAAAAAIVAAAEVSSLGGGGGASGGSSGSSASGGGSSQHAPLAQQGISALGAQRAGAAAMSLEVIITNKAPDGRTLQQQRQLLQRLNDRAVPVRMNLG